MSRGKDKKGAAAFCPRGLPLATVPDTTGLQKTESRLVRLSQTNRGKQRMKVDAITQAVSLGRRGIIGCVVSYGTDGMSALSYC